MATASERLGFFELPREVRDEIYRLSFSKSYILRNNGSGLGVNDTMMLISIRNPGGPLESYRLLIPRNFTDPSEFHILHISQKVRFEAEEILYHDSTFCLHLWDSYHGTLSQELADRFINLCIYIPHRDSTDHDRDFDHQVLKMFCGNRARGKICTIKFYPGTLVHWMPDTHLFSILKTFTGFKTVRIQFSDPYPPSTQQDLRRMQDNMRPMRELLERGLGDAMAFEDSNVRGLEFHPQDRASAHNA